MSVHVIVHHKDWVERGQLHAFVGVGASKGLILRGGIMFKEFPLLISQQTRHSAMQI